ncbi:MULTISPECIES: tRNA 2-thiouridine(34) synthase MnmA [Candidatus Accumulibacter]|uniref:tRNA-specific 2-thiouridylase MnmA n=1 Tax=Candidatus Accumulibacter phosphatis TaxID=327160 RepID=A0A5S4EK97_9PROT|nr:MULTISPECIES: tRNA 2-thiouridine(34) synthase MnmA [Candidatus Accumulibacter]MBL8401209.1 tRNA 2-thiouridine(34) synthase MnmA [Accumulibacter sp.]MCC2869878.1 tRNA 2-thiouridine(34) synthase MnmA [Candidatus Accumulibacter phosphatis]TMQ75792.1 tRNA-specific 2-thiouridylase MnmA [Candidatus Accumulibacter phosphatis]HMW54147.1 tRNA 2-thiouridine(34) synthase MnmA [Accumulibacter sp.]
MNKGNTVVVGLSGGVDSSVAAWLLKQQGWHVVGLFMKNWEDDDGDEYCASRQDLIDVISVADTLGIEVEVLNFAREYKERVFAHFLKEYQAGRTPNPDVLCNPEIKFSAFLEYALKIGAQRIATGHYAGVREFQGAWQLLKAEDGTKDQSYFLYRLNQQQLAKTLFPLAGLYKRDVRKIAEAAGLHVALKKDSTGICFIGERPFKDFLMRYLPKSQGEIRCLDDDRVLGEHDGVAYHTIGQRKGLHIGGVRGGKSGDHGDHDAWFVARKDVAENILYVVQGHDHPALLADEVSAWDLSWVAGEAPHTHWVYTAKTRYRQADAACEIERVGADACLIRFAEPQWAITPGQSVVVYESRVCLGGGVIA